MRINKPAYNSINLLVVWFFLAASMLTCPVKKAINTYHHLPTNTQSLSPSPTVTKNCSFHETQDRFNTTEKEKSAYVTVKQFLSGHFPIEATQYAAIRSSDDPVFTNGPPLFLRFRHILV
jgi:hypothetical protein